MARFPTREADIRALVQHIIAGLEGNPDFPNPPIASAELQGMLDNSIALKEAQVAAYAAAHQATEAEQAAVRFGVGKSSVGRWTKRLDPCRTRNKTATKIVSDHRVSA